MKSASLHKNLVKSVLSLLLFIILFSHNNKAHAQLLDSLTLDTMTAFISIEDALKHPDQVIKLELRKKRFKKFPPEIFKFTNLQYLDLSKNNIQNIPDEIGTLKNLQYLSISRNGLEEITPQIGNLKNLYYLEANNNDLTSLPAEIGKLEKLKNLDLWSNDIDKFPVSMRDLKNLELVDLRVIMIPDAEQARLQSYLPHAKIYFSPFCKCAQ